MFRRTPSEPIDLVDREIDLRAQEDPDPFVEAAADRLRRELGSLEAFDQWGRPLPWRQVARIALGPLVTPRVRDALTSDALEQHTLSVSPEPEAPQWRALFKAVDETDRLL